MGVLGHLRHLPRGDRRWALFHLTLLAVMTSCSYRLFGGCYAAVKERLSERRESVEAFNNATRLSRVRGVSGVHADGHIDISSIDDFKRTRAAWHRTFKRLNRELEQEFVYDDSGELCVSSVIRLFCATDSAAACLLVATAVYFVWQDTRTPFGASRHTVFIGAHLLVGIFSTLATAPDYTAASRIASRSPVPRARRTWRPGPRDAPRWRRHRGASWRRGVWGWPRTSWRRRFVAFSFFSFFG